MFGLLELIFNIPENIIQWINIIQWNILHSFSLLNSVLNLKL